MDTKEIVGKSKFPGVFIALNVEAFHDEIPIEIPTVGSLVAEITFHLTADNFDNTCDHH